MVEVTVAIAVYKVEKYIEQAIRSVLEQDFDNLEILVCNDCTPDRSLDIIKSLAQSHPNGHKIRIVSTPTNMGTAAVRNLSIEQARGKYLYIIDGDDYMAPDTISLLYAKIKKEQAEIVSANILSFIDGNDGEYTYLFNYPECDVKGPFAIAQWMKQTKTDFYYAGMCNKLYDLDFLRRHDIKCIVSHRVSEDTYFTFQTILYATTFSFISDACLFYRRSPQSATLAVFDEKRMDLWLSVFDDICSKIAAYRNQHPDVNLPPQLYNYVNYYFVKGFVMMRVMESKDLDRKQKKRYLDRIAGFSKYGMRKEYLTSGNARMQYAMLTSPLRYWLFRYVMPFSIQLLNTTRKIKRKIFS